MNNKINILKALAILLVVSGHLEFSLIPMFPPYSFQVVLFFLLPACCSNLITDFWNTLEKIKSLMIPYVVYSIIYLGITQLITPFAGKFWGICL